VKGRFHFPIHVEDFQLDRYVDTKRGERNLTSEIPKRYLKRLVKKLG